MFQKIWHVRNVNLPNILVENLWFLGLFFTNCSLQKCSPQIWFSQNLILNVSGNFSSELTCQFKVTFLNSEFPSKSVIRETVNVHCRAITRFAYLIIMKNEVSKSLWFYFLCTLWNLPNILLSKWPSSNSLMRWCGNLLLILPPVCVMSHVTYHGY